MANGYLRSSGPAEEPGGWPEVDSQPESGPPIHPRSRGRLRPPPDGPDPMGDRLGLYGVDGRLIAGRELPSDARTAARQVVLRGKIIGELRMAALPLPGQVEISFLRRQYIGIAVLSGLLLLLACASAWLIARQWARPLIAVQHATASIARGDTDTRIAEDRSDEIGDVIRNVNQMAESLARLESSRRRWLAEISHELRTPLAALRGEIEALADGVRPLTHAAVLSLKEDVLRIGAVVEDLHMLALSDINALPCEFEATEVAQLLQRIGERYAPRAKDRGLDLELRIPPQAAMIASWDRRRIDQLVSNLLENSVRYTDAPGRIRLSLVICGGDAKIEVQDSAPGVPESQAAGLFAPLFRADAVRSRNNSGSGLGLSICKAIAAAHQGEIAAGPSTLGGLCILVRLPLQPKIAI